MALKQGSSMTAGLDLSLVLGSLRARNRHITHQARRSVDEGLDSPFVRRIPRRFPECNGIRRGNIG